MSAEKGKRLFDVEVKELSYMVSATSPAKARKWVTDSINVREIGAVEAVGIDKDSINEAE